MRCEEIETLISEGLKCVRAQVLSDDGTHFEAVVVSSAFDGCRPLQRHQMVYATLGARVGREIHALSLQTYTPGEWAAAGGETG